MKKKSIFLPFCFFVFLSLLFLFLAKGNVLAQGYDTPVPVPPTAGPACTGSGCGGDCGECSRCSGGFCGNGDGCPCSNQGGCTKEGCDAGYCSNDVENSVCSGGTCPEDTRCTPHCNESCPKGAVCSYCPVGCDGCTNTRQCMDGIISWTSGTPIPTDVPPTNVPPTDEPTHPPGDPSHTPTPTPTPTAPTTPPDAFIQGNVHNECKTDERWKAEGCGAGGCSISGCDGSCSGNCNVASGLNIRCTAIDEGFSEDVGWGCGGDGLAYYASSMSFKSDNRVECTITNIPAGYDVVSWVHVDSAGTSLESGSCTDPTTCTGTISYTHALVAGGDNYLHFKIRPKFKLKGTIGTFGYECPNLTTVELNGGSMSLVSYEYPNLLGGEVYIHSLHLPVGDPYYDVSYGYCDGSCSPTNWTDFSYYPGSPPSYSFSRCRRDDFMFVWRCRPYIFGPWFQTRDMDVHGQVDVNSQIPIVVLVDNYLSLKGANDPGVISFGNNLETGSGGISGDGKNWQAKTTYQGKEMKFEYLKNVLKVDTSIRLDNCHGFPLNCPIPAVSGTYYQGYTGTVTLLGGVTSLDKKVVIFVDGGVTVEGDITVAQGGFFALIAKGNITISGSVNQAQGFFSADGSMTIVDGGTLHQFVGQGSFVGWGGVSCDRNLDIGNNSTPACFFESRPDFYINAPKEFNIVPFNFQEVAP